MAKGINTNADGSIVDLENEEELSDDSFFEDDFNEDTHEDSLGKLLSCNTLGVESKVKLYILYILYNYIIIIL